MAIGTLRTALAPATTKLRNLADNLDFGAIGKTGRMHLLDAKNEYSRLIRTFGDVNVLELRLRGFRKSDFNRFEALVDALVSEQADRRLSALQKIRAAVNQIWSRLSIDLMSAVRIGRLRGRES